MYDVMMIRTMGKAPPPPPGP